MWIRIQPTKISVDLGIRKTASLNYCYSVPGYSFGQLEHFVGILMSNYAREMEEVGKDDEEEASVSYQSPYL
jgi:hypothetical protein